MSKRAGAASTNDKSETGSGKKRRRADWPPSQPGKEISYTFTAKKLWDSPQMICQLLQAEWSRACVQKGSTATMPKQSSTIILTVTMPTIFSRREAKYCLAHPLVAADGKNKRGNVHMCIGV